MRSLVAALHSVCQCQSVKTQFSSWLNLASVFCHGGNAHLCNQYVTMVVNLAVT